MLKEYENFEALIKGTPLTPHSIFGCCELCETWRPNLEKDHKVPKHKGGLDVDSNIQFLCSNCHSEKTALERQELFRHRIGAKNPMFGRRQSSEWKAQKRQQLLGKRRGPYQKKSVLSIKNQNTNQQPQS